MDDKRIIFCCIVLAILSIINISILITILFIKDKIDQISTESSINSERIKKIFYSIRILLKKEYNINIDEFCEKYTALLNDHNKEAVNNKGDEE